MFHNSTFMKLMSSLLIAFVMGATCSCNSHGGIYNIDYFQNFLGKDYSYCNSTLLNRGFSFNMKRTPNELADFEEVSYAEPILGDYIAIFFDQNSPSLARRVFVKVEQNEKCLMLKKSLEENGYQVVRQGKSRNPKVSLNLYQKGTSSIVFATHADNKTYGFDFCSEEVFEKVYKTVF